MLETGNIGRWFEKKSDAEIVVCFRNVNSLMTVADRQFTTVGSVKAALELFASAKAASAAGELDDAFKASQRKVPVRKAK